MAEKNGNRRALIGLAIFLALISANILLRLNRPSGTTSAPATQELLSTTPPVQSSQVSSTKSPAQPNAGTSASAPQANTLLTPLPQSSPIEAIQTLRDRLKQLPPILRLASPSILLSAEPRNPFQWLLPEPIPTIPASDTILATSPTGLPKPVEEKISFSGAFVTLGCRSAFLRKGKELYLVKERETIPRTTLILTTISSDSAVLEDATGVKTTVTSERKESEGFLKALAVLQGKERSPGFPIHEVFKASGTINPLVASGGNPL